MTAVLYLGWFVLFVAAFALATLRVSVETQLVTSLVVIAVMALLKFVRAKGMLRNLFLILASFMVLRYIWWRATATLPPVDTPVSFAIGLLLFLAELYTVTMFFISLFVVADPVRRAPPPPIRRMEDVPTVDVFVPSYNEDPEMLAITLSAAQQMRYPADKLRVHLLDDGGTDQRVNSPDPALAERSRARRRTLQELCAKIGVNYLTRERNVHAKAGNMSAAMTRTSGELIVIFDADHVPTHDFLERTIGYFVADPKLFLVQTPHFFISADPVERNLGFYDKMPGENDMFYGLIQRGLDKWNGSFFCGSAAVVRRAALDSAGGFSGDSITEDAETALELHSRGWKSLYVDRPMVAGLQPETFVGFIGQRSRWAQGMFQILLLKRPYLKRGLSLQQRLCYLSSSAFWLFPFARLAFFLAPLAFLFFGLEIYRATFEEFIAYTLLYVVAVFLNQNFLFRNFRWPLISELYEFVQSVYIFRALGAVALKPRAPEFKVTNKGETLDRDFVSPIARPLIILCLLLLAGLGAAVWRWYTDPLVRDVVLVVGGWNVFNLLFALAALGVVCERQQRRKAPRVPLGRPATVSVAGAAGTPGLARARIEDVSMGGAELMLDVGALPAHVQSGDGVVIRASDGAGGVLADVRATIRKRVVQGGSLVLGVSYDEDQTAEGIRSISRLMFGDSAAWQAVLDRRRRGPGVIVGLLWFIGLALRSAVTSTRFILGLRRRPAAPPAAASGGGPSSAFPSSPPPRPAAVASFGPRAETGTP